MYKKELECNENAGRIAGYTGQEQESLELCRLTGRAPNRCSKIAL